MFVYVVNKKLLVRLAAIAAAVVALIILLVSLLAGGSSNTTWAPAKRQLPVYRVQQAAGQKQVALTFDTAWGPEQVYEILDVLERYKVTATFFIVGFWADEYPEATRAIVARGHELGNHSANHLHMPQLSQEQMQADLEANNQKIFSLTGTTPKLFRPPFGEYSDELLQAAQQLGMTPVQWSLDVRDWDGLSADEITSRVTKNLQPGDIVLMHVNQPQTVEALEHILAYITANGYTAVPLSSLLLSGATVVDDNGVQRPAAG